MDISFCIVSLNSIKLLKKCLDSIPCSVKGYSYEVIVADNYSYDNTVGILRRLYPEVRLIANNRNIGYTKAMNKILKVSRGNFKVVLNPDSKLMECSISKMVDFMKNNSMIGVVGPKVVDSYGQFQMSCRRGLARPGAVFSYFFGKAIGKTKLINISPKKTIEGLVGGVIASSLFAIIFSYYFEILINIQLIIYIFLIIFSSLSGDLIESYFKRKNNLKNSSNIIPGHGGVFDRFDSFLFSIIVYSIFVSF